MRKTPGRADPTPPCAILRDAARGTWLQFSGLRRVVSAFSLSEVIPALADVEDEVRHSAMVAAGFVSYEAAPAFDSALTAKSPDSFPLLWFGLFEDVREVALPPRDGNLTSPEFAWEPSVTRAEYVRTIDRIKALIESGDTYQVDYTYRVNSHFEDDPWPFFLHLVAAQEPPFGAYLHTGEWAICSASPELFLALDGDLLQSRPMKGTAPRGLTLAHDIENAARLRASEKERAENVMIVDMVRNDLGRVARTGSVNVRDLFVTEKYPTVWQMTSTVEARTDTGLCGLFRGAYPAASITGAPKVRTMQIIEELEATPRHVYTGAIGFVATDGRLQFNVAIRTLLVDTKTGAAEYGVGSGVVWDSDAIREWDECATKTKILTAKMPLFHLLETMLWKPGEGIILEEPHIQRLTDSAKYFAFNIDFDLVRQQLHNAVSSLPANPHRVRLLCGKAGDISIEATPAGNGLPVQPRVGIARLPINAADVFLYHKTTNRSVYDKARRELPGYDDVVLYNEDGEVTESTIANVVAEISGELRTPPVRCGLLPGTMRADLLAQGSIIEGVITLDDLIGSPRVFLVNSVRGMVEIHLSDTREQPKA